MGGVTFYRHEVQFYPYLAEPWRAKRYHRRCLRRNWKRSFHWTRFHYIYSILLYGLKDSTTRIKGVPGVYSHEHILRGTYYLCYTHIPDRFCYCVCCEIDIEDTWPVTCKPGNQQLATREEYVRVTAVWTSALTMVDLHNLTAREKVVTLLGMWDPASEIVIAQNPLE